MSTFFRFIALAVAFACLTFASLAQDAASPTVSSGSATLPGGASSLTEQHGDWTVSCAISEGGKRCNLFQELVASATGQRVLSLELAPVDNGALLRGVLIAPLGLVLAEGVTLAIDDSAPKGPQGFVTCSEIGCPAPFEFNTAEIVTLRAGAELSAIAIAADSGEPVVFTLSLAGITSASNRAAELMR